MNGEEDGSAKSESMLRLRESWFEFRIWVVPLSPACSIRSLYSA